MGRRVQASGVPNSKRLEGYGREQQDSATLSCDGEEVKVLVGIPMYGKAEYTRKCIEMVLENAGINCQILVVDDGSPEPFTYEHNRVFIHRLEKNSGYTAAQNASILWAQERNYDYVHCLNNDTEPCPNFLKELMDVMEKDSTVGIACSIRQYPSNGKIELCGADLIRGHQYFADDKMPMEPIEINWAPICSGLLRMSMVREIGMLDKRFRNHCSDSWYCLQAKLRHWKVILVPKSKVMHHLSVTTTSLNINADHDQKLFIELLACLDMATLLKEMPLDLESKTYGKLDFTTYKK